MKVVDSECERSSIAVASSDSACHVEGAKLLPKSKETRETKDVAIRTGSDGWRVWRGRRFQSGSVFICFVGFSRRGRRQQKCFIYILVILHKYCIFT